MSEAESFMSLVPIFDFSMIRNNAHLEKETTVRTEFGSPYDRNALASGLVEGETLKCAHLNLPTFRLAGNLNDFPAPCGAFSSY
jgi:hypothetical protein